MLIALHWASPRQTAALSAPLYWQIRSSGLPVLVCRAGPAAQTWQYALAALAGAMIGTTVGLRWLSQRMTRYTLAAILVAAGIQLVAF